ncbi:pseudouridine synthase [Mucilaginibacter myungsuensis]|uniref:Pseudouridine synthase n=1 Tax=Mucilaginibacter myungsuensis TaxID=649104 RepID=A0A929KTX8_9SPHI|nr:pseudouridine synthase [Mucilaginibacter myungsuensis]MBE9661511.1 pseudouridine synthase [Mucilaginibacter myungsuensis]MDN3597654.1 pseudouridine synthase [Mucilaginibacter myungsuensis]
MVFKKPGNGREDKSNTSGRPSRGDASKSTGRSSTSSSRGRSAAGASGSDRPKRSYNNSDSDEKRSFSRKPAGTGYGPGDKPAGKFGGSAGGDKKPFGDRKPYGSRDSKPGFGDKKPYGSRSAEGGDKKPYGSRDSKPGFGDRPKRSFGSGATGDKKPFGRPSTGGFKKREDGANETPFRKREESSYAGAPSRERRNDDAQPKRTMRGRNKKEVKPVDDGLIRLNRYISNAGICSRRKADELITAGVVSVNGEVVNELGFKVDPFKDTVRYNGETLKREKMTYVLLNKPKDYITTTEDPQERRTIMHLVEKASRERIYPVGRLDRNTTGLILMTNDGDLADKLSHPRNNITKLYQVELNKSLTQGDMNKIGFGLELEDGFIKPDHVAYVAGGSKREVGIQIHSGKNRIVRRIFESLGYEVVKLDRTIYANLTKKDLPRGRWRFLEEEEIIQLKHLMK